MSLQVTLVQHTEITGRGGRHGIVGGLGALLKERVTLGTGENRNGVPRHRETRRSHAKEH